MAKQTISLGTAPTGQGGDTPRSASVKTIANFDEIYAALGAPASGVIPPGTAAGALINGDPAGGAIMRAAANANGYYFQFNSGLLICMVAFAGYSAGATKTMAWPFAFVPGANVGVSCSITPYTGYDSDSCAWSDSNRVSFRSGNTRQENVVVLTGIGWWK